MILLEHSRCQSTHVAKHRHSDVCSGGVYNGNKRRNGCSSIGPWQMRHEQENSIIKSSQSQVWWHTPLIPALGSRGRQISESSRTARAVKRNPVSKRKKERKEKEMKTSQSLASQLLEGLRKGDGLSLSSL